MPSKVLGRLEATEIINTMLDEYGLDRIEVVWNKHDECWDTPDVRYKKVFFFFKKKYLKGSWISSSTLDDLIVKTEESLDKNYSTLHGRVKGIRERHAARLLDKEINK